MKSKKIKNPKVDTEAIIKRLSSGQRKLREAKKKLKTDFVGNDLIIDRAFAQLEAWYLMPELLQRPTIVNLWGMTGVGKTDFVRKLVGYLDFSDRFCEIELSNNDDNNSRFEKSSIANILGNHRNIESGKPCIVLLDEIQKFRTVNPDGSDSNKGAFSDIWALLSDGMLPHQADASDIYEAIWVLKRRMERAEYKSRNDNKSKKTKANKVQIRDLIIEAGHTIEPSAEEDDDDDDGDYDWQYQDSFYQLTNFKEMLRLKEPIEEIATWDDFKRLEILQDHLNGKMIYEDDDYRKALIFISGNLDEVFGFAKATDQIDIDADIFHEMSKRITLLDVKKALNNRFKPEQIARFGNGHVIYPSISKSSYKDIIKKRVGEVLAHTKDFSNIQMSVDDSIYKLIYDNGVFPTQGTRPVFSTTSLVLESSLPKFILECLKEKTNKVSLSYENKKLIAKIGSKTVRIPFEGDVDAIKKKNHGQVDRLVKTAVHEAGHAVAYAALFGLSPNQIVATVASTDTSGFVLNHHHCYSKDMMTNEVMVLLSGYVAEKIIFTKNKMGAGSESDRQKATHLVADMIRHLGMEGFASYIWNGDEEQNKFHTDLEATNDKIEMILKDLEMKTELLLKDKVDILTELTDLLISKSTVLPEEFQAICAKNGLDVAIKNSDYDKYEPYAKMYKSFKK